MPFCKEQHSRSDTGAATNQIFKNLKFTNMDNREIEKKLKHEFSCENDKEVNKELIKTITGYADDVVNVICHFKDMNAFFDLEEGIYSEDYVIQSFVAGFPSVKFRGKSIVNIA